MSVNHITETSICIREATTRYINITCKSNETHQAFDFDGYTVQTYLSFGPNKRYVNTAIINNIVSYKIPADISVGVRNGIAETRIFKNGDVFEVLRINVAVQDAEKPDLVPNE